MTLYTISADSHVTEPGECYLDIDPRFRDRAPRADTDDQMGAVIVIDEGRARIPYGMIAAAGRPAESIHPYNYVPWEELHPGGWDPAARLDEQDQDGVSVEILDLRSVLPWDKGAVLASVRKTSKVIVLHEDTLTGGFGAEIAATIAEEAFEDLDAPVKRVAAPDAPVPFSPPLEKAYIPQVDDVAAALRELAEY